MQKLNAKKNRGKVIHHLPPIPEPLPGPLVLAYTARFSKNYLIISRIYPVLRTFTRRREIQFRELIRSKARCETYEQMFSTSRQHWRAMKQSMIARWS